MGCIVNGPGESKHADVGISLPGAGEQPTAPVFIDGKKAATLRGPALVTDFKQMVSSGGLGAVRARRSRARQLSFCHHRACPGMTKKPRLET